MAFTGHMPIFISGGSAYHRRVMQVGAFGAAEPRRIWYAVLVAAEGVPQYYLLPQPVEDDREAVAAADEVPVLVGERWPRRRESRGRDAVWRVQSRVEDGVSASNP
jgi:hypothetical protein